MLRVLFLACCCLALSAAPPEKKQLPATAGNERVEIEAHLLLTKEEAQQALEADPGAGLILVSVKVTPKGDEPLAVSPDDFFLKSDKDGQRTQPFSPSQIAGRSTLVVKQTSRGGVVASDRERGRVIGGLPGTGQRPIPIGDNGLTGGTATTQTGVEAKEGTTDDKENPLLAKLKAKALNDVTAKEGVTGLLYFPIDGKQKKKDLELTYKGAAGKLVMRFP